jgi:[glutamine synthetase] adenylyltransferase / [glutamine synthetase]-adenylyl-L-tyrosine phosphorylase
MTGIPPEVANAVEAALAGEGDFELTGLRDWEHAAVNLRALANRFGPCAETTALIVQILGASLGTPDANTALNGLERFAAAFPTPDELSRHLRFNADSLAAILSVFSQSHFLSDILVRFPEYYWWLVRADVLRSSKSPADYRRDCLQAVADLPDRQAGKNALCRLKLREILRIGARDLLRIVTIEEITREISDLAQSVIMTAADIAWQETVARFGEPTTETNVSIAAPEPSTSYTPDIHTCGLCIIAMGKLGGRELNFSSDIDLVFIYEAEGQSTGTLPDGRKTASQTNHVFFTRMCENLVNFLSERGEEGNLFRVDMRLRPEGKAGPLVRSLESFANYLSQQARDWERLAYLKARVLTGPAQLAERIYRFTQEFVFSGVAPAQILSEVQSLKVMIDRDVVNGALYHREVKRGYGGIREIEFVIAAMQIIYGQAHPALRVRNIFLAIERLCEVDLLSPDESRFYLHAYEFLRVVEHRLQMAAERQTHTIPEDPQELEQFARCCCFQGREQFLAHYRETTDGVHSRFVRFFEHDVDAVNRISRDILTVLDPHIPPEEALTALTRFGLTDPGAVALIRDLCYGTREVFISAEGQRFFEQMLPSLLRMISNAPMPARVLPHLHSFVLSIKGITYYYEVIAQHPEILNLLVSLFGSSSHFSAILASHPEFFDELISSHLLFEEDPAADVRARIRAAVTAPRKFERKLIMFRRSAKSEYLRIALRHILQLRSLRQTLTALSDLAEIFLGTALPLAVERTCERLSADEASTFRALVEERFAVLALGKFGGRELNFFSDLDVVFIHDDRADDTSKGHLQESFTLLCDALNHVMSENLQEGRVGVLDARLRPHGRNAPLATALSLCTSYFADEAQTWELQAYSRARHVAGNPDVSRTLISAIERKIAGLDPSALRADLRHMRVRLEDSVPPDERARSEFKRMPGGLVDIEFLLQWLILSKQIPSHQVTEDYFSLFETIAEHEVLPDRLVASLSEDYGFLRRLETGTRLVTGAASDTLPPDMENREALARMLGFTSVELLMRHLDDTQRRVRASYVEIVGEPDAPA